MPQERPLIAWENWKFSEVQFGHDNVQSRTRDQSCSGATCNQGNNGLQRVQSSISASLEFQKGKFHLCREGAENVSKWGKSIFNFQMLIEVSRKALAEKIIFIALLVHFCALINFYGFACAMNARLPSSTHHARLPSRRI